MTVNFDLLVAGCNTRCRHCYVNGGPAPLMETETALAALRTLDKLASLLPYDVSFTLDNEPFNHPDIGEILRASAATKHISCHHHGMTTGIALMRREDRSDILKTCLECGFSDFGVTLHGNASHHDGIVRREGAFGAALAFADFAKAAGCEIGVSLLFNRFYAGDAEAIGEALARLEPSRIYFAVPNYTPHRNMADFEPFRGSRAGLKAFRPERFGQKEPGFCTPALFKESLRNGLDVRMLFGRPQDERYLTVHPDGDLFYGNTGAETECLGNVRELDVERTASRIRELPANRDYGAFYDPDTLPGREELCGALERIPEDLLYDGPESVLYRCLSLLDVPTRILSFS